MKRRQARKGAICEVPNLKSFGLAFLEVAQRQLGGAAEAVLNGTDFGKGGESYQRISCAASIEMIEAGITRMENIFGAM